MRNKRINSTTLAVIAFMLLYLFSMVNYTASSDTHQSGSAYMPESDTAFGGIFYQPRPDPLLPYFQYKNAEDSIRNLEDVKNRINESRSSSSIGIGDIGLATFEESVIPGKKSPDYYLFLNGYSIYDRTQFFVQNGTYNLAYIQWDSSGKRDNREFRDGHYERKQISVRYSREEKQVLIPISDTQYQVFKYILWALWLVAGILLINTLFVLPIKILVNISGGKAFSLKNIRMLRTMYSTALIWGAFLLLKPSLVYLLLRRSLTDDFKPAPFTNAISENLAVLGFGLIIFIISKAFEKGYKLQQEQDLTI